MEENYSMTTEQTPKQLIEAQVKIYSQWLDEVVLENLRALPVLPDEDIWSGNTRIGDFNPIWDDPEIDKQLTQFLAFADIVRNRKLREGVPLLLERASYGDMGETMRGLRHSLEAAFNPDWEALTDICIEAAQYPQRGARLWAVDELGVLRNKKALPVLFQALRDSAMLVRHEAIRSLITIGDANPELKSDISNELKKVMEEILETQNALLSGLLEIRF